MPRKSVLILCTGNSARSQMAEGILRKLAGDRLDVFSAGTKPSTVRDEAIAAMREIGIDISSHRSKSVDEFIGRPINYVITVCNNAAQSCPIFPATTARFHWPFEDPPPPSAGEQVALPIFRKVRDQIQARFITALADGELL